MFFIKPCLSYLGIFTPDFSRIQYLTILRGQVYVNRLFGFAFDNDDFIAGEFQPRPEVSPAYGAGEGAGQGAPGAYHPAGHRLSYIAGQRTAYHYHPVILTERIDSGSTLFIEIPDAIPPSTDEVRRY